MEQPTTTTDTKVWFKLIVILLFLLALPEYMQFGYGGFTYSSVLFNIGSYVGIMQLPSTGPVSVTPRAHHSGSNTLAARHHLLC